MKKGILFFLLAAAPLFFVASCGDKEDAEVKLSKKDRMDLAMEQEYEMTKDENGNVPRELLMDALEIMNAQNKTTAAIPSISWTNLGPTNQAGRSKTLLVDANDPTGNTVFVGSVGGGIWRTTNIFTSSPNWTPINDFMQNLSITSLGQDPTNSMILYASTGEPYGSTSSIRGLGVFKSTDGGNTWNQLASTNNTDFYQCAKLIVASNGDVYVATTRGIFQSTDAGTTFTRVLSSSSAGASSSRGHDVKQAANGDLYASLQGSLHKSVNNGNTWSPLALGFTSERIEIACAPSNANALYVLVERNNVAYRIAKSTTGGNSWTTLPEPNDDDGGIPATDFTRGQAWYDLCIAVDPNDENVVFVGGIDLFRSSNGGSSWTQISHWYGGFGHQEVHADQHNILFPSGSSDTVYFCNDGGIYNTVNGNSNVPNITNRGQNLVTLQLYGCDAHPTNSYYLGGAQDNGSHKYTSNSLQATTEVTGGDGAFCNIDQDETNYQYTQYVYNQYRRSANGGGSFSSVNLSSSLGRFINPSDYDDVNNIMYAASSSNNYVRWNNPHTGNNYDNVSASFSGGKVSTVRVSPNVNNQVYFGDDNGNVFRVSNAHTNSPTVTSISSGLPNNKYTSCIAVEAGNENHMLVTFSNYSTNSIYETTNGGTNWTSVEGNLPDMPVRWAVFNPNDADQAIIATELGVWSTDNLNGGTTNWGATNNGLANVRVDMIRVNDNKQMIASTHGRGMFYSNSLNVPTNIPVASITVMGQGNVSTITTMGGSLQMVATVLPSNATNPAVAWSVTPITGAATINATGLLTAQANGTVTVTATSTDGTNISGSTVITLSNQSIVDVDSIDVYGQGRIFTISVPKGKLQMIADIYPITASNKNVSWNMLPGGTGAAAMDINGELTALANGTVIVEAIALDGSNVRGTAVITISKQTPLSNTDVELSAIRLYPNPSNGVLFLNAHNSVSTLTVMSLDGRTMRNYDAAQTIDVSSLPKGIYVAVVRLKNGQTKSQRIVLR